MFFCNKKYNNVAVTSWLRSADVWNTTGFVYMTEEGLTVYNFLSISTEASNVIGVSPAFRIA